MFEYLCPVAFTSVARSIWSREEGALLLQSHLNKQTEENQQLQSRCHNLTEEMEQLRTRCCKQARTFRTR